MITWYCKVRANVNTNTESTVNESKIPSRSTSNGHAKSIAGVDIKGKGRIKVKQLAKSREN